MARRLVVLFVLSPFILGFLVSLIVFYFIFLFVITYIFIGWCLLLISNFHSVFPRNDSIIHDVLKKLALLKKNVNFHGAHSVHN